jgi:hypothetical protein
MPVVRRQPIIIREGKPMGTKNDPSKYDCHEKAEPDEPMFTLLARDEKAPHLVRLWAELREGMEGLSEKVLEARACADAMEAWRAEHR